MDVGDDTTACNVGLDKAIEPFISANAEMHLGDALGMFFQVLHSSSRTSAETYSMAVITAQMRTADLRARSDIETNVEVMLRRYSGAGTRGRANMWDSKLEVRGPIGHVFHIVI